MSDKSSIDMFIMVYCSRCNNSNCEGAINDKHRESCRKYTEWLKLRDKDKAVLYIATAQKEIMFLEDLLNN